MIPKKIHYCWFGGNPKPEIIEKCIASWHAFCPDWEIVEWNESNYDVSAYPYMQEAYEAKKWAFVSDVARLDIVVKHGGIYLDTDVELLSMNPFDSYLHYENILVFENERGIATGLTFGAQKNSVLCRKLLEPYNGLSFLENGPILNTTINRDVFVAEFPGLKWNAKTQTFGNTYIMGTDEYHRYMKHYGTKTWCDNLPKYTLTGDMPIKRFLRNPAIFEKLEASPLGKKVLPVYQFLAYDLLDLGPFYFVRRIIAVRIGSK